MDIKKNYIADEILNSINFEKNSSNIEDAKKYTARRSLNFSGKDTNLSAISKRPSNILKVDLKQTLTFLGYGVTAYASSSMPIALLFSLFQMINEFLEMFNIELQREDAEVVWVIYRSNEDINLDNLFTIYSETFCNTK